jgi:hypothetical protein
MCKWWHNLWNKPDPGISMIKVEKRIISATVNKYPNPANNLNGCNADQDQAFKTLLGYWSSFDLKGYKDSLSTKERYKSDAATAIGLLDPGATVIVMADSCFSGTITRAFNTVNPHPTKNRFYQNPELSVRANVNRAFASRNASPMKWITMSACGENQYSADAYISSSYHGAYSWFAWNCLRPGMTYQEWQNAINKSLPSSEFEQKPQIEGPAELLNRKVFEGQCLLLQNSSHGTQTDDLNGDENDGYDEAIYLYNGMVTDDEINEILQKIPK